MGLFTIGKKLAQAADGLFDDVAVQAKHFGEKNGHFDEQAWFNANPRPEGPADSKPVKAWLGRKRNDKKRANQGPTPKAPLGYDSLGRRIMSEGELAYIRTHPNPFPDRSTTSLNAEEEKIYKQWDYGRRLAKQGRQAIRDGNNQSYQNTKDELLPRRRAKRDARTPEEVEADRQKNRERNRHPERKQYNQEYNRRHYLENPGYYIDKGRARRQGIEEQTPAHANMDAINEIYRRRDQLNEAARASGSDMEFVIDHVVPLTGHRPGVPTKHFSDETRTASGLNVQDNLLIVPRDLNSGKGAWYEPGDDPMTMNEVARRRLLQQAEEGLLGPIK